ncbi:MAG: hypothetical protein AB7T05_11465, partial [Fimbriimonadaceae bacterium]
RGIELSYDNGSFRERRVQIFGVSGSYRPMRQLQLAMRNEFVSPKGKTTCSRSYRGHGTSVDSKRSAGVSSAETMM